MLAIAILALGYFAPSTPAKVACLAAVALWLVRSIELPVQR